MPAYKTEMSRIDERAVLRDVADPENAEEHYYLLKDLYTVTGLAGSNGLLEEAYVYDTYGQAVIHAWPVGDVNRDGLVEADGGLKSVLFGVAFVSCRHFELAPVK